MIASSKYIVGLYSLQDGDYRLSLGPTFQPFTPILADKNEDETRHILALHESDAEQTVLVSLDRWSHRFFKISTTIEFRIRGEAFMDEQDLVIGIENLTQHTIIDCQIYFSNRLFFFGNIVPNKKQVKRLTGSGIREREPFQIEGAERIAKGIAPDAANPLLEEMQKNLMKELLVSIHSRYHSRQDAIHLFGWIESDVMPIRLMGSSVTGEGLALLEWEIPVMSSKKNGKIGLARGRS